MSVTAPEGFVAAGVGCGIKAGGDPDLALVATADGHAVPAAAVTTANQATAAPVLVTRAHLAASAGRAAAVLLNSGNANAATGQPGLADAERSCTLVAEELGCRPQHVLVCSTGLIGIPLPMEVVVSGIPAVARSLRRDGGHDAARAIMTTDTVRKETAVAADGFTVGGMAKGAAMLAPNMATMLAVLTTDAAADPEVLQEVLRLAVADSFNALSVDGCTSTNDTVILLANGRAGAVDPGALADAVAAACDDLAGQMAGDAEGATKVVRVTVEGAVDDADAERAARRIAESQLCKCSWYGEDPYWGRVLSEAGSSGAAYEHDRAAVSYGGITVCRRGVAATHDAGALAEVMARRTIELVVDLGLGRGSATILTNDLTHAYVDENMGTS